MKHAGALLQYGRTGTLPTSMYHAFVEIRQSLSLSHHGAQAGRWVGVLAALFGDPAYTPKTIMKWIALHQQHTHFCKYVIYPAVFLSGRKRRADLLPLFSQFGVHHRDTLKRDGHTMKAYHPFLLPLSIDPDMPASSSGSLSRGTTDDKWTAEVLIGHFLYTGDSQGLVRLARVVKGVKPAIGHGRAFMRRVEHVEYIRKRINTIARQYDLPDVLVPETGDAATKGDRTLQNYQMLLSSNQLSVEERATLRAKYRDAVRGQKK